LVLLIGSNAKVQIEPEILSIKSMKNKVQANQEQLSLCADGERKGVRDVISESEVQINRDKH
jgi:hypothetical protein